MTSRSVVLQYVEGEHHKFMVVVPKLCSLIFVIDPSESRVLLGLKKRGFGAGNYNGFGGKLEKGESMRACCSRELEEESGLSVPPAAFQRRAVLTFNMLADGMRNADGSIASVIEVHTYSCLREDASGELVETDEMAPQWFPLDALPFAQMWADDEHWLPLMLGGSDVIGDFVFRDSQTILSKRMDVLPSGQLQRDELCTRRLRVDHLVYGVPGSLEDACAAFEARTGIAPTFGGVHKGLGTHNALVALGGPDDGSNGGSFGYLEILALDPEQQPNPARLWMAMDSVVARGEPSLITWASDRAAPPGLDACVASAKELGYDAGEVEQFTRATPNGAQLEWKLAYRHYEEATLPAEGIVPFLIEWEAACRHHIPSATAPRGIELLSLRAEAAEPDDAAATLAAVGIEAADLLGIDGSEGDASEPARSRLVATLRTPKGLLRLG